MGELSFSYPQSFEKSDHLGKTYWHAVIRVYDEARNVIETHDHSGGSKSGEAFTGITWHFPLKRISERFPVRICAYL
jgi:hypothetical protein